MVWWPVLIIPMLGMRRQMGPLGATNQFGILQFQLTERPCLKKIKRLMMPKE